MRISSWKGLAAAALMLLGAGTAWAVPNVLQYQGRLTDASGANVANGSYSIVFAVYAVSTGGVALYSETQAAVTVANGLFNVVIGSVTPIPATLFDGSDRYLGIKVGADPEMTPRQRITSVGYALRAQTLETAPGISISERYGSATSIAPNSAGLIDSVDIAIPAGGFILVEAGCESFINHSNGTLSWMQFQVTENLGIVAFSSGYMQHFIGGGLPSETYDGQVYCRKVFQKATAGSYHFRFMGRTNSGTGGNYNNAWVSATYFPALYGTLSLLSEETSSANGAPALDPSGRRSGAPR